MLRVVLRAATAALMLTLVAGCHKSGGPTMDPVGEIAFTQPPDVQVDKVTTPSVIVTYPEPVASGGIPPLTVTCSPASGAAFPVGTTVVRCTATDGIRQAETHFNVTIVAVVPVLAVTKFLAFGDSITAGEVQTNPSVLALDPSLAYPKVLQDILTARYTGQTVTVDNLGHPLETADEGTARLGQAIALVHPEALLLLQGVLDIQDGPGEIPDMINSLRHDIGLARSQNVQHIFLSTLTPEKNHLFGCQAGNDLALGWVGDASAAIRTLAAEQGVYLVDAYDAMIGQVDTLIGCDGLHPTKEGYVVLAKAFFDVIKAKLESIPPLPAASGAGSGLFLRPNVKVRPQPQRQPIGIGRREQ